VVGRAFRTGDLGIPDAGSLHAPWPASRALRVGKPDGLRPPLTPARSRGGRHLSGEGECGQARTRRALPRAPSTGEQGSGRCRRGGNRADASSTESKTVTAFPLVTVLSARRGTGGQGRGRTADLPLFRRTLVPTELPAQVRHPERCLELAVLTGLEPATSALTGRRALQLLHRTLTSWIVACPQRDSNPCYRLERAASWAARRWGRPRHHRIRRSRR
jgi:hypothetical protein